MGKITDRLPVYYGWSKINKVQRREALMVIFLNDNPGMRIGKDGECGVTRFITPAYKRLQTKDESADGKSSNRIYSVFSIYMDDPRINGSLQAALDVNFMADRNNVSKDERDKIKNALRNMYIECHKNYKEPVRQLELEL